MKKKVLSEKLEFFVLLSSTRNRCVHHFEGIFSNTHFNEFLILYFLYQSFEYKSKRVDLAKKLGITQSGIVRILKKMEGNNLVTTDPPSLAIFQDARTKYVKLTTEGEQLLHTYLERAEAHAEYLNHNVNIKTIKKFNQILKIISSNTLY